MSEELKYSKKKYLELQEQENIYIKNRRGLEGVRQVIYRNKKRQKPEIFETHTKYIFLQYISMVYEWAERKYGYTRDEIDFLLYAYPIGVFNKFQVEDMLKTLKMHRKVTINRLIKKGGLKVWREKKGKQLELYKLSTSANHMCSSMHKVIVNEGVLPSSNQSVFGEDKSESNKFYLNIIKQMSKKVGSDSN